MCFVYFQLKSSPRRHNSRLWRPNEITESAAAAAVPCSSSSSAARCRGWPAGCQLIQGDGFRTHSGTLTLLNGFDSLVDVAAI